MGILYSLLAKIQRHKNPAAFWKKRGAHIGQNTEIYASANFGSEPYLITIGNHVRINSGVQLMTHDGGVWVLRYLYDDLKNVDLFGQITIGDNVHIGTNAIIMPGVTIGSNCIIGCGSIVTKNVPDNSVVVGIPGRVIESIDEYLKKNENRMDYTKEMNSLQKKDFLSKKYGK